MKRTGNNRAMVASKTRIPEGWRLVRLGDVAEINPRRPPLSVPAETPVTFLPMAAIAESSQGIVARESRPYSEVSTGYTYFEENDFLFSKITPCLQNGKHTLATGLRGGFGFGTTEFHVVRTSSILTAPFMFRALTQAHIIDRCSKSFTGTAGQQRVQPETLKDLPILLPPLPEQRAIAAVLDSIDDAIECTDAVIAATEQLRGSLLHQLLTRGVPGWHTAWKDVTGLGAMPADWDVVSLGEETTHVGSGVTPRGGKSVYTSSGITFLRSQNVYFEGLELDDVVFIPTEIDDVMRRSRVQPNDVLLNITGASIGRCTVVPADLGPANVNQHVCIVRTTEKLNPRFVWKWLSTPRSQQEIDDIQTGQSRQGLNYQQVRQLTIARPYRTEQDAIVEILGGVDAALTRVRHEQHGFKVLKDSIADALLTGRVRLMGK